MKTINNTKYTVLAMASCALLTACGGGNQSTEPSKPSLLSAVQSGSNSGSGGGGDQGNAPPTCQQLVGLVIPSTIIGLPTTGAVVTSAAVTDGSTLPVPAGQFCKVLGNINPIDPNAPAIGFELNLPVNWNHKAMMFGGGGFDGVLSTFPSGLGNILVAASNHASPLARGYATFGSNSGHVLQPPFIFGRDGSFATNDEALANYGGDALKKTHDTAKFLIQLYYGSTPQKMYFQGGSTGGREAMIVTQRWPQDFDGAIAEFPNYNESAWILQGGRVSRALAQAGAFLSVGKRQLLLAASIANCDQYDGVADGIISNVAACNEHFDPATATVNGSSSGASLRCAGGAELGDSCLSDAQISALKVYASRFKFGYTLASGDKRYPGFNVWGTDLGIPSSNPDLALNVVTGLNLDQPADQVTPNMPYMTAIYDQWAKYFITRNATYASLTLDPKHPGALLPRINVVSQLMDASNSNLSAFRQKGGKLLIIHGLQDAIVSPQASADYYKALQKKLGKSTVDSFVRFWTVPGYGHGNSPVFNATVDLVTALENWAEAGTAPQNMVTVDKTGIVGRSRPLCDYPKWPHYNGSGDVNLATSFTCIKGNDDDEHDEHDDHEDDDD